MTENKWYQFNKTDIKNYFGWWSSPEWLRNGALQNGEYEKNDNTEKFIKQCMIKLFWKGW